MFFDLIPRLIPLILVIAVVLSSLSLPLTACASTGAFAGILEGVGPPRYQGPNDPEKASKLKSLQIRSKFVLYQSNTKHHTGELVTDYQLRSTSSPAIGGHLTSVQVFANALKHLRGHYIFVYEDKHFDLSATPPFTFGLLRDVDMESGELTIDVPQAGLRFHYSENPIVRVKEQLNPDATFRTEPWQDLPRETAPRMVGRWVQVHPPRKQMIWVESDKAQWNADHLPTRATNATRGGPNSLTHNAMFLRYVPMLFNTYGGRYFLGMEIETIQNTDREKDQISDRFQARPMLTELGDERVRVARGGRGVELLRGATLDQHVVPGWVAQRPGRSFAANHYRREGFPHQRYFQTDDDEVRGTIVAADGDKITVSTTGRDGEARQVIIDVNPEARLFLDGSLTAKIHDYKRGQFIRVFPEREHQTVVFFNEYRPFGTDAIDRDDTSSVKKMGAVFHPQAYFRASDLVINESTEITFDGSFSYDPHGKQIKRYDWQFGDGTKAQGPKVTRTYRPVGPYRREIVKLTVTDENGLTDTWIEYVEITDGLMPAQKVDAARLKPGMVAEAWGSGNLSDFSFAYRPADHYRGVVNWYVLNGKDHGEKCVKRYSGWFEVGESGEHEIRGAGSSGECILLLDGVPVIDTTKTVDYGWGYEPYLQQRSRVFLEKGWHRFEFYHSKRQHTLSWNGPGVTYPNPLHDIAPVYHLQEEAGDARVRYWLIGAPTSSGRPLVTRDGQAPDRSREPRVLVKD